MGTEWVSARSSLDPFPCPFTELTCVQGYESTNWQALERCHPHEDHWWHNQPSAVFFFKSSQIIEWSQVRRMKHLHPIMQVWAESPGRQSNCMTGEFGLLSWIIPCWILCAYVSVTRIGSFSARILKGKAWASQELCNIFLAGNKFRPLIFFFFFP